MTVERKWQMTRNLQKVEFSLSGEVEANARTYAMAGRNGVEIGGPTVTYDADGHSVSSCGMWTANAGSTRKQQHFQCGNHRVQIGTHNF